MLENVYVNFKCDSSQVQRTAKTIWKRDVDQNSMSQEEGKRVEFSIYNTWAVPGEGGTVVNVFLDSKSLFFD